MNPFLKDMAAAQGFEIDEAECKVFGDKRIDHVWRRGNIEVAIEHENEYTTIENQIKTWCDRNSNLKILIMFQTKTLFLTLIRYPPKSRVSSMLKAIGMGSF